ncbi:extracellular solute-binding protein [Streptosporangium longisporum]|uniref:ABC transporter substrate-binding protein n=1 Tax=Streptosporangium longisporum TaxID=46187 RepID=A0ABP6LC34_9ACTN
MAESRASADTIEINVWLADYPFPTYDGEDFLAPVRRRAEEFGVAHPEYRVVIREVPFPAMAQEVARAVEDGTPPDVAGYYASAGRTALDTLGPDGRPLFTPVGRAIGGRTEILGEPVVVDDLIPAVRAHHSRGGELLSMPVSATTFLLYANRTLLAEAGVTGIPRTWEEVEEACAAVARLRGGPAVTWADHGWLFQQALAAQGGPLADNDNGRSGRARTVDLASKEMLAWVEWWRSMHARGYYLHTGAVADWMGTFQAFAGGRVAFLLDSSKSAQEIVGAGAAAGFEVAVGRMPYNGDVPYVGSAVSGDSLWLADGLDEARRDGALAFMQYLASPANAAAWHRATGFVPVTGASADLLEKEGWFDEHPHQRVAVEQLRASDCSPAALGPLVGDVAAIHTALTGAMEDVLTGDADPAARFVRATEEAQRALDDYNADCDGPTPRTPRRLVID